MFEAVFAPHQLKLNLCRIGYSRFLLFLPLASSAPQYLMEAGWAAEGKVIGVTQPRRVAAISVRAPLIIFFHNSLFANSIELQANVVPTEEHVPAFNDIFWPSFLLIGGEPCCRGARGPPGTRGGLHHPI